MSLVRNIKVLVQLLCLVALALASATVSQASVTELIPAKSRLAAVVQRQISTQPPQIQPYYIYKGGPTIDFFPVNTNPFGPVFTFPTGQYTLGIAGTFLAQGMLIQQVTPNSPADKAGLVPGDFVYKMDGVTVTNQQLFNQVLSASGGVIQMVVQGKNGQFRQLVIPLQPDGARISAPYILGVRGAYGVLGLTLNKVYAGTPADQAGIKVGDQIVTMNNFKIANDAQFFQVLYASSGRLYLQIRRAGKIYFVKVRPQLFRFGTLGTFSPAGASVELVSPGTPASRAGFQPLDLIQQVDARVINSQASFDTAINLSEGSCVMTVRKAAATGKVAVELMNNSLCCWCQPALGGMRLLNSPAGTLANGAGLIKGDIILQIDNTNTQTLDAMQVALENARGIMAVTYRSVNTGQVGTINVNLGNFFN
jgi:S1-C subfamily serine protease